MTRVSGSPRRRQNGGNTRPMRRPKRRRRCSKTPARRTWSAERLAGSHGRPQRPCPQRPRRAGRRSAMAKQRVIELTREKETPGTVRFQEQDPDEDPKVGTLYVKKAVSYTHLRAHETVLDLVCRLLLEK